MSGLSTGSNGVSRGASRAAGLLLGYAADRALGDPRRWHPVAGFGQVASALESRTYAPSRARGALHVAVLVGGAVGVGVVGERVAGGPAGGPGAASGRPVAHALMTAVATWAVLGGRSLGREAAALDRLLAEERLPEARERLTHLVGRDPSTLGPDEIARAAVESLAENTSDAVVAPLVLGAALGLPGLLGYRAANTLDAMVGHRSSRYAEFGWAAARLDDVLNLPGSRLTAALATALGPDRRGAWRVWRRDARRHPSPNAGPVEAAFAGALGLRLGGRNVYDGVPDDRPVLGDGRPVEPSDIVRARGLADRVSLAAALVCAGGAALLARRTT